MTYMRQAKNAPSVRDDIKRSMDDSLAHPIELADRDLHGKKKAEGHWGYHLLVDCSDCNKNIDDEKTIEEFLKAMVQTLDMKPLGDPQVVRVDNAEEGRGVSAMQFITTSTIQAHFDDQGMAGYIDVFSCQQFDPEDAIKLIDEYFEPKRMGKIFIYRDAADYPDGN